MNINNPRLTLAAAKHYLRYGYPVPLDVLTALDAQGIDIASLEQEVDNEYDNIKSGGTNVDDEEE